MTSPTMPPQSPSPAEIGFKSAFELIQAPLSQVEDQIRRQALAFDPGLEGYVSYVCNSSGKRLRPALALLSGGGAGEIANHHVNLAVIIELIHIATLVHDDIMDGAELRREQPTANAKWGNAISVLLGDCLFAHALQLATHFDNAEISRRIARAATEVCSGEILQTQRRFDLKLAVADYYKMIEMKTAALFAVACELGAFLSNADEKTISKYHQFGQKLGIAYQIYDDCVDLTGSESDVGKTLGTDLRKGKFTLPILVLLQNAERAELDEIRGLLLREEDSDLGQLSVLLQESGALQKAVVTARDLLAQSQTILESLPSNPYREGLVSIAAYIDGLL